MTEAERIAAGVAGAALAALGVAALLGFVSLAAGEDALARGNAAYLQAARDAAVADLATLGAVKGVLDIVASARVGFDFVVSADVGVGEGLAALATAVDDAMAAVMLSVAANEALALALAVAQTATGPLAAATATALGLWLLSLAAGMARLPPLMAEIARALALALLIAHVALPYAVHVTGWAALGATQAAHGHVAGGLAALYRDVVGQAAGTTGFGTWSDKHAVAAAYDHLNHDVAQKLQATVSVSWMHAARAAVFGALFPLALVLALVIAADRLLRAAGVAATAPPVVAPAPHDHPTKSKPRSAAPATPKTAPSAQETAP